MFWSLFIRKICKIMEYLIISLVQQNHTFWNPRLRPTEYVTVCFTRLHFFDIDDMLGRILQTQNPRLVVRENTSTYIDARKLSISTAKNAEASMGMVGKPHPWPQKGHHVGLFKAPEFGAEYPFEETIVFLLVSGEGTMHLFHKYINIKIKPKTKTDWWFPRQFDPSYTPTTHHRLCQLSDLIEKRSKHRRRCWGLKVNGPMAFSFHALTLWGFFGWFFGGVFLTKKMKKRGGSHQLKNFFQFGERELGGVKRWILFEYDFKSCRWYGEVVYIKHVWYQHHQCLVFYFSKMTRNMSRLNDVYTPRTSNIVPENWFPWKKIWFPWSLGDTCFPQLWNLPPRIRKAPLKIKPRNDPFFLFFLHLWITWVQKKGHLSISQRKGSLDGWSHSYVGC